MAWRRTGEEPLSKLIAYMHQSASMVQDVHALHISYIIDRDSICKTSV